MERNLTLAWVDGFAGGYRCWRFLHLPGSDGLDNFAGRPANMICLLDAVLDLS